MLVAASPTTSVLERVCVIQTKSVLTNLQVDVEWRTADSRAVDVDRRARWRTGNMGANAVRLGLRLGGLNRPRQCRAERCSTARQQPSDQRGYANSGDCRRGAGQLGRPPSTSGR